MARGLEWSFVSVRNAMSSLSSGLHIRCGRSLRPLVCHAVSASSPTPGHGRATRVRDLLRVTVTVRWIPLVTAACGTRVARPARTTMLPPGGDGSQRPQGEARPRRPTVSLASCRGSARPRTGRAGSRATLRLAGSASRENTDGMALAQCPGGVAGAGGRVGPAGQAPSPASERREDGP
jgi:hypothetical protein